MIRIVVLAVALFGTGAAQSAPLVLEPAGLLLPTGRHVRFGMKAADATALATAALGRPIRHGTYSDCGQGIPIVHIHYRDGLELSFIDGRFVGWTLDKAGPRTATGIGIGSTLADVRRAYPDVDTDAFDDQLRFIREVGPNGFVTGKGATARVVSLNSGQTCIVD
jgi:hypothetical protein